MVYTLNVQARDDQTLTTDEIHMQATLSAAGDGNTSDNMATDLTTMVLFRNGFEKYGNGAEVMRMPANAALLGNIDGAQMQVLDLGEAWGSHGKIVNLAVIGHGPRDRISVQAMRVGDGLRVRLRGTAAGQHVATEWTPVASGRHRLAVSLATTDGHSALVLVGARGDQALRLSDGAARLQVEGMRPGG